MTGNIRTDLRADAIPLVGVAPDLPDDDLAPLLERLATARLVGLGEATRHGFVILPLARSTALRQSSIA